MYLPASISNKLHLSTSHGEGPTSHRRGPTGTWHPKVQAPCFVFAGYSLCPLQVKGNLDMRK